MKTVSFLLVIFLTFLSTFNLFSQTPVIQWQKCLGGSGVEYAYYTQETSDGGYIVTGYTESNDGDVSGNHGGNDAWVVKLNSSGSIQWKKCLGGSYNDFANSIQQTSDGGYIVAASAHSNDGDVSGNHGNYFDFWIVKLNTSGSIQWQKCLGGTSNDYAYYIHETSDGGYIVAGTALSNDGDVSGNHGSWDVWVVRLNSSGVIQWQKCLGGSNDDNAYSVQETSDSGYIVAGWTGSNDGDVSGNHGGIYDAWVVKLNSSGNIQWQKCLGGSNYDIARATQQTSDGGYIVAGLSDSNDGDVSGNHGGIYDAWIVKLNSSGNIQWQKCLGGSDYDVVLRIQETSDSGYIVAGTTGSNDGDVSGNHGGNDAWIVKLNSSGNIQWQKCMGGSDNEWGCSIQKTSDDGYILSGGAASNNGDVSGNHGASDYWIVKLTLNSISTGTISPLSLCQKATVNVPYTASGTFNAGNIFTAQLSNATASFASGTTIGTLSSTNSGSINCTIPSNTTPGSGYRIRVVSSNPTVIGTDNGANITINALPVPLITGPDTVCEDGKYIYTCTSPGSITSQWRIINGKFDGPSSGSSVVVEWDSPPSGTITLVQTTTSNCVDSSNLVVTINPKADADITTSDTILCVGQTGLYLSNTEAGILYKWVVNRGIIIGADNTPTLTVRWDTAGTGLVRLIHTFASTGCSDTNEINVIVSPLPQPQITTSDTVLCINSTGQYTSNTDASATYQWLSTGGVIQGVSNTSSVTVLWNTEGANKIKLIQTYPTTGCKDSTEKTITINPLPDTQIEGNSNVLVNSTVQYRANTPPDVVNSWWVNFGTINGSNSDSVLSVSWGSVGTGEVILEQTVLSTNCEKYDTLAVTIYATIPPLMLNAGQDKVICNGESVRIGNPNAASGGVEPYNYKWSPSTGLSDDAIPNPIADPQNTTIYTLTVTDVRDSSVSNDVTVTVNPLPLPQISGSTSALLNSEETYSANTPAGTTNIWSVTNGTQIGPNTGSTFKVKWDLLGSEKVILKQTITSTGCTASDTLDITIGTSLPSLTVEAGPAQSICQGDSVQIGSANPASGGQPPYRYLWTPSLGLSNDTVPNPMASPQQSTTYSLIVLDSKDSTTIDSVIVTIYPLPKPEIKGNTSVVVDSTITYSADTPIWTENLWSVENGTPEAEMNKNTFKVTWNMLGTGRVILKQTITTTGCIDADTIDVIITSTIPALIADAGSDKSVCLGDTVQIGSINAASGGVEPYKFKWSPSLGLSNDTIPNPIAKPLQTTVYRLTVSDSQDSISTDSITVTVNPLPTPHITGNSSVMKGTTEFYTVEQQTGLTNEWSVENGNQRNSGKGNTFEVKWDFAGTGKVIVEQTITATGCHASDTLIVTIDASQYAAVLDIPDLTGEPGGEITLPIYLRNADALQNTYVKTIYANLKFNASLLELISPKLPDSLSPDGKERTIFLSLGVKPIKDSTLFELNFMAMLGDDSTTALLLEKISTEGANVNVGSLPGTFTLTGICREGGARLIGYGPAVSVVINPNPVTNTCKIEYQTYKGYAKLYIVNSFGEIVKTLIDSELSAGWHTADYDLTNVPSGVYFVILQNETKRKAVRMDILK